MIKLHQFPTSLGIPNPSPFCIKAETYLKLAGLPYEVVVTPDPRKAPLGKLPYIVDGDRVIHDSSCIVEHLERVHGVKLDAALTTAQRAAAHAFQRMLEEHLYWAVVYARWIEDIGWNTIRPIYFAPLPALLRPLISRVARGQVRRDLHGHGLGRHHRDEIYRRAAQDIDAIAAQLGDQPFFFGGEPTGIDASVYAFLASCWQVQVDSPLKAAVALHPNLTAYCARMSGRCFAPPKV
jgi:glutathione S-transferase